MIHAANFAQLSSASILGLVSGSIGWVDSVLDEFRFERPSMLPIDGVTVLSVQGHPNARWVRKNLPHPNWIAQTLWNLDSNGNPEGNGTTQPIPAMEYYRRTGAKRVIEGNGALALNLVNGNLAVSDPLILSFAGAKIPSQVIITGTAPTVLATGTLSTFSGHVPGTNNFAQITNTVGAAMDWSPFVDKLIRLTSGPQANVGASWILFNKGAGVAYTDDWYHPDDSFVNDQPPFAPAGNETYEILELQSIGQMIVDVSTSGSQNMDPRNVTITLQYVKTPSGLDGFFAPNMMFFRQCELFNMFVVGPTALVWTSNCAWTGFFAGIVQWGQCAIQGGHFAGTSIINGGSWYFDDNPIVRGAGFFPATSLNSSFSPSFRIHGGLGFLNCSPVLFGAIIPMLQGSQFSLRGFIWGENNTGDLFGLSGSRCVHFAFAAPIEGVGLTGNVFVLNGQTSVRAYDDSTGAYTADHRATTAANLAASVAAGGFGGNMFDPKQPICGVFATTDA